MFQTETTFFERMNEKDIFKSLIYYGMYEAFFADDGRCFFSILMTQEAQSQKRLLKLSPEADHLCNFSKIGLLKSSEAVKMQ